MTRVCWLLGHKYVQQAFTGEYGTEPYVNPITLIKSRVPIVTLNQMSYCVRCGKDRPK